MSALLEAGADKHSFDKDQLTGKVIFVLVYCKSRMQIFLALHCAASRGHGEVIRTICKTASDIQINSRDRNGSSPLFYAAALGHLDAVKALLEYKAISDLQDKKLRTPVHCAAAKGQVGTLKLLLQHGASFALENYRGDLPIHEAVQAGSLGMYVPTCKKVKNLVYTFWWYQIYQNKALRKLHRMVFSRRNLELWFLR